MPSVLSREKLTNVESIALAFRVPDQVSVRELESTVGALFQPAITIKLVKEAKLFSSIDQKYLT